MANDVGKVPVKGGEAERTGGAALTQPGRAIRSLRDEIDRLFDDFSSSAWNFPFGRRAFSLEPFWSRQPAPSAIMPVVDMVEKDKEFQITAELPGLDEKDVEVTLSDDVLTISGEKREEKEEKRKGYYMSERSYGSFSRAFRLPDGIDREKIDAKFEKGVLSVVLPKSPEAQKKEKKIAIKGK
ncbi:MAG: Hsp20/alpha crystallin family protein [Alphaproteobacteria bacterium]